MLNPVYMQVKPTTKFSKIFDAYAGKQGVEAANIKFLHDGQRIRDHQTPGELGIEVRQDGACSLSCPQRLWPGISLATLELSEGFIGCAGQ